MPQGSQLPRGARIAPIALAVTLAVGAMFAPATVRAQEATTNISIAAQPLGQALNELARQANLQLIFPPQLVAGKTAPSVSGTLTAREALERLLAHSGLVASVEGTAVIIKTAAPASRSAEATLSAIHVGASADSASAASGYRARQSAVAGFTEQAIIDTPFSVKVLPTELLTNQKVESISSIDRLDASVTAAGSNPGWYSSPAIRGFDLDNWSNFRHNGQFLVNQQATGLENKERVEILKGLSALQAGFAAPGGLINYVTKRPTSDALTDLHLSTTHYGNAKIHADLSRRSDDGRFGLRMNAAVEDERSHVRKVDGDRSFVALAADWQLTRDTLLQVDVEYEKRNQTAQPALRQDVNGDLPSDVDPRRFLGQSWARYPTEFTLVSGKLEHFLNEQWSVALDANWMKLERDQDTIYLLGIQPNGDADAYLYHSPEQTREPASGRLTVKGRFDTGPVAHELAFGASTYRHEARWVGNDYWDVLGTTNIHAPVRFANPSPVLADPGLARRDEETGLFVNDVLSFGEAWKLHLGGRYAVRDQKGFDTETGAETSHYRKSVFTPSAALVFKPRPNISTYVSYVEGLEQGGTAPLGTTNQSEEMPPLTSEQWEIGVKADISPALAVEAAVFRIDRPSEYVNAANTYVQDGLQRHQGLELALTGKLTQEWTLFASALFLNAEFRKTDDPSTEGNRPAGTPEQRMALTAEYSPLALPGWTFGGNWTHTGSRPVNDANRGESAPAYDIFGLGARFETKAAGTPMTIRVNVDNLFDTFYWADARRTLTPGAPRTVSASVSLRF